MNGPSGVRTFLPARWGEAPAQAFPVGARCTRFCRVRSGGTHIASGCHGAVGRRGSRHVHVSNEQDKLNGYQTLKTVLFHHQHSFPNKGESVSHSSFGHAQVKEPYTQGCLAPLSTLPDWLLPGLHEMHSHIQVFTMLSSEPGEPCSQHCCPSALLSPCRRHPYLSSLPRGSYPPGRFSWPSVLGRRAHPTAQPHPL